MKKRFLPWTLSLFLVLTPLLSISPTALLAIVTNANDEDATVTPLELREYSRTLVREDLQHFGDLHIPGDNRMSLFVFSATDLGRFPADIKSFAIVSTAQIRAPPTHGEFV